MRGEGVDALKKGAVAMDTSKSHFMELLLCQNKKKKIRRDLNVKGH